MVKPYGMYTGIGLYSNEYTSVEEIPDGSQIAVMNDASNEDVALRILEDADLIKISEDVELATVADIVENPKNLEIIEMSRLRLLPRWRIWLPPAVGLLIWLLLERIRLPTL